MMAAGADDAGTAANVGINATRAAMPADQLAEARRLGLYVDPASEYGSDLLAGLQQRRGLSDVMGVGARHNQNLLTGAAGRAAGIDGPVINRFTLDQAMERTKNGFEVLAGETQAVPKIHVERKLAALLDDPMAHAPLIRRLKQAPEMLDGRQLGSLQSFLAKERFKFNKGGDLNMAEAYDMAHNDILNVIERGLPKGSRGNFGRLRQEYHGQMVLDRPGVLGAGDTVNPTSFYMATRKAGRASDSLKVARRMAMHMHNMRETLGNSGTAGRSKELMGGLLGTGGAAFGGLVGGPVGAAIGGAAGGAAGMAGYGPGALFAAYNRSAPMLAGLMQRGQGGL